jgi:crossover junction endodeoxyribonuclease RusA
MTEPRRPAYRTAGQPQPFTVVLPWPARELSPNARIHRMAKAGYAAAARRDAFLVARAALLDCGDPVYCGALEMTIAIHPPDGKRRDLDNVHASLKSCIDGIFQALCVDDSSVRRVTLEWGERCPGGKVAVLIREIGG